MIEPRDLPALSREELLALVVELQRQMTELRAEIDQLKRGGKRQAAPFSKGTRVAKPKPPGRKPGAGPFRSREAPPPEAITALPGDVKVTLEACPACGGPLEEERVDLAYRTEIPRTPATAGDPVPRVGLSVHGVWPQGAWPASRPGAGPSWGDGPPRGAAGDGGGAGVARWPRHPGAQSPHGLAPLDWGTADPGDPHPGCPAAGRRSGGHRVCPVAGCDPGGPGGAYR